MLRKLRERFNRFMIGRYGMDALGQFLARVVFVLIILNFILRGRAVSALLGALELAGILLLYGRMFSKNMGRRHAENELYLRRAFYVSEAWKKWKDRFRQSRKYRIFSCPGCGQKVRIPRGHGKVSIRCPKCGNEFIKKS